MVDYKAIVVLVPSLPPRPTENFPGNYPSSEEAEQLEELEEIERVKQIQADTRELVFTPEQTTYRVGRASRNPKKGIAAAKDNCLFQSPVMSRLQAEIEMVPKKKHLRIRDTDSMHGTYLNGKLIWGKHWQALNSGDTLTFGAQVTRAGEVFMPKHFTCDVAWEKLDSNTQTPSSDKPERRIAGYGLSTEDLIVSDDDTESVEYDKGSDDYSAYSAYSEEEYSDDSEQEDSDYEKDTDNMAIDEDLPTNPTQTEEHKYEGQGKEEFNHDPTIKTVKLPGLLSLVPENPPSRSKFSIGSLMNHTQDASSSKSLTEKGNVENAAEFKLGGNIVSTKLTAGEIGGQQAEVKVEQASSNSLDPISKIETANKAHCSNLFQEVESECESDDAPEELDTKSRTVWNSTSVPEDTKNSTEKTVQESVKPVLHPPVLQSADIEKSPSIQKTLSNLLDAVKPDLKKQDQTTTSGEAAGHSKIIPCPPQKDEFFAAMRDNQATLVNLMRDKWPKIPESTTSFSQPFSADATDGLHSSPLPWVRRCYAPLTNPSAAPQQLYVPMKHPNTQESSGSNQPMAQNARMPHLFERLLESDEAKARTERLEKLKAAVYSHQRREVSYNSWTMEDEEEDLEETYLEDEDTEMALDEAAENLFATRPAMENSYILQLEDKSKPRGFSISNLVDNQPARTTPLKPVPDRCQWAAEKFSKGSTDEDNTIFDEVAPKLSDENTDSNKPREIMSHIAPPRPNLKRTYEEAALYEDVTDDKIVQETDAVEEKIAEPVDHPMVDEDVNMREVSEEKEMYEELTPVAPVMLNETTKTSEVRESSKQAEPQQPPTKRARIFTTGFALGAVTGAVGVFAALVASAP